MSLEEEMRNEIRKLEKELFEIDVTIQKLSLKTVNLINIRKKKEHDLKILRETFEPSTEREDIQITLDRTVKRRV